VYDAAGVQAPAILGGRQRCSTALGSTDSSTDLFTPTIQTAEPGFEVFDPVPEPSSFAIPALALGGLGVFRRFAK
jgi:PEP-CTERM motif